MEISGRDSTSKFKRSTATTNLTEVQGTGHFRNEASDSAEESPEPSESSDDDMNQKEEFRVMNSNTTAVILSAAADESSTKNAGIKMKRGKRKRSDEVRKTKKENNSGGGKESRVNIFEGREAFSHLDEELQYEISSIYQSDALMKELAGFAQFYLLTYKNNENAILIGEDIVCMMVEKLITGDRSRQREKYPDFKEFCRQLMKSIIKNEKKKIKNEDNEYKLNRTLTDRGEEISIINNHSRESKEEAEKALEYKEFSEYVRSKLKEYDTLTQKVFKLTLEEYQSSEIARMLKTSVGKVELSKKKYVKLKRDYKKYFNRETTKERRLRKNKNSNKA